MSETKIPGVKAFHRFVTKNCRKRPRMAWILEVLNGVRDQLMSLDESWVRTSSVKFHIVITVENPDPKSGKVFGEK